MPQSYFTPQFQSPHNADPRSMVLRDLWRPAVLRCEIPGAHAEVTAWRYFYCLLTTSEKGSVQTLMFRPTQRPNPTVARRPQFVVCAFSVARLRRARQGHAKIYIRKEGGGVRILRATEPGRSFELAPTESAATVSRSVRAMRGLLRGRRRS
jgi:hypothetical protein